MSDITITVQDDATGSIIIDGAHQPINAADVVTARTHAMQQATNHARATGRTVTVTANDPTGQFHLAVQPDGSITNQPAPTTPSWEDPATDPIISEIPNAQGDPEATRPRVITHSIEDLNVSPTSEPAPADSQLAPQRGTQATTDGPGTTAPATFPAVPLDEAVNVPRITEIPELLEGGSVDATAALSTAPDPLENDPRWAEIVQQPATQGFRGTLNGMGMKLSPTEDELNQRREDLRQDMAREEQERLAAEEHARMTAAQNSRRAAREREAAAKDKAQRAIIQTNLERPKSVLIVNYKGGQGKTTATYGIAATAGRIRGGDVIAWDANETRGNLGFRSQKAPTERSVVDLIEEAAEDFTTVEGSKRSTLARYTRPQGDNHFAVLASDESSDKQDLVDGDAFETVREILGRFYSLILIDTGNNHRVSHFTAALEAADQLLVPVGAGDDGAHAAEAMLDRFERLGHSELVRNAVVLLTDSGTRRGDSTGIAAKFEQRVRAIIPIPFDPVLDTGGEIDFDALQPATRAAYQEATAAIAQGLAEGEQKGN